MKSVSITPIQASTCKKSHNRYQIFPRGSRTALAGSNLVVGKQLSNSCMKSFLTTTRLNICCRSFSRVASIFFQFHLLSNKTFFFHPIHVLDIANIACSRSTLLIGRPGITIFNKEKENERKAK